jgi:hypothetical protein
MATKKITEYERFMTLTDAQKDAEVAMYDQYPHGYPFGKSLRKSDRVLDRLAKARGRAVPRAKFLPPTGLRRPDRPTRVRAGPKSVKGPGSCL